MSQLGSLLEPLRADTRLRKVALLLLVTYAYFVPAPAWNENSRFALTRALVEEQTTRIDSSHYTTGDKSRRGEHFYSDKAPGASMLAVIPYATYYWLRRAVGAPPLGVQVVPLDSLDTEAARVPEPDALEAGDRLRYDMAFRAGLYFSNLCTTVLVSVLGFAALYLVALRWLGGHRDHALAVALGYALATPAFVYSTALYGHQLCASFLIMPFALIVLLEPGGSGRAASLLVGVGLGLAVLCEYPAVVPAGALTLYAATRHGMRFAGTVVAVGSLFAILLGTYHQVSFGGPLRTGYDFVYLPHFAEGMRVRYGLALPDPQVLMQLMFGSYRGLFYVSPLLLVATWGLMSGWRSSAVVRIDRVAMLMAAGVVAYYLILNASYYMWDGGAAFGPRHCVPMLPFLALGLAPVITYLPGVFWALAAWSLAQGVAGANAGPEMPQWGDPLWEHAWPELMRSGLAWHHRTTNVGHMLGLPGPLSLVPLLALWAWLRPWSQAGTSSESERKNESG
ncbi:MAG: hypothetical protein V3V08_20580 [Nannocystaceae bacterium]